MYIFKCFLFARPLSIPRPRDVQMDTRVHKFAHTGTFRQINVSLAGVKLLCVHIYT